MPIKVKMLETRPGSPDGIRVLRYVQGEVVELPDHLAKVFVDEKWAELASRRAPAAPEAKALGAAAENKAGGGDGEENVQSDTGKEAGAGKEEVAAKPRQATRRP